MRSAYLRGLVPLGLLLAGALAAGPAPRTPAPPPLTGGDVYRQALRAVGWAHATDKGQGTAWIVDRSRRWLVTCYHVVGDNATVEIIFPVRQDGALVSRRTHYLTHLPALRKSGHAVQGRVLRRNPDTDLALIELASLPPEVGELRLADASARPGDRAHVVGNRYDVGVLWTYGRGAVRQVRVLREGYFTAGQQLGKGARVVIAAVPINEGDSGGPLLDERGQVIGVSAAVAWEAQGAGLFIDVSAVRDLLRMAPVRETGPREAYQRGLHCLALVQYSGGPRSGGVLLDRVRRLLLTTAEAVAQEKTVDVTFPVYQAGQAVAEARFYAEQRDLLRRKGALVSGTVLATDTRRNLALLELDAVPASAEEVALSRSVPAPGDALHVVSNPDRLRALWAYSAAWVRQVGHFAVGQGDEGPGPAVLLLQAPLREGDGGGPVLDDRGGLVGLVSGKVAPQQQVAYALTLAEVRAFLIEARPRSAPATAPEWVERAGVFVKAHRPDRARADLDAALRLAPTSALAFAERGRVRHLLGDLDGALADCDRAVRLAPALPIAHAYRGAVWCDKGQPAKALADGDEALRLDRRCALAHAVRGLAHLLQGDDQAVAECDEAIWLDRQLAFAHLVRGRAYARKDDHVRAIEDFTRALLLDPHLKGVHLLRAESHWARSDVAGALADYAQAVELDGRDADALRGRGRALLARREVRAGVTDLMAAVRRRRGLARAVLADVERRGAELEQEAPASACELYRQALMGLAEALASPTVEKLVREAERVADEKKRAQALREVMRALEKQLPPAGAVTPRPGPS